MKERQILTQTKEWLISGFGKDDIDFYKKEGNNWIYTFIMHGKGDDKFFLFATPQRINISQVAQAIKYFKLRGVDNVVYETLI